MACLLLAAACGGGSDDGGAGGGPGNPVVTTSYQVEFSPEQVIAGPAAPDTVTVIANLSSARGDDIIASGSITVSGTAATSVTINPGYAGETGPAAVTLSDGGGGTWNVPAGTEIDPDDQFRLDATGFYVSIQSPDGALRGQILPADWGVAIIDLDASSAVPASTSTGTAKAGFAINSQTGRYRVRMTVAGINDAISAGVRNAIAGARGDVVIALEQSATDPNVWGSRDLNNVNADDRLTQTGLDLLVSGALYFSLESVANMTGDLRGQVAVDPIRVFDTELTTYEVVTSGPPVVSAATGFATVTWVDVLSRFAVAVNTDISDALSVYVQQGAPGENGTVVFSLTPDSTLPGNWVLPVSELTAEQADAFGNGEFYVSIVTADNVDGELRGQLDPATDEMTSVKAVGENGGKLSVTDGNGVRYTLTVSPDALVDETVEMTLSVAPQPVPLPAGLTPIAAVRLEPAGTAFAEYPQLQIDAALPAGPKIAFVANDDFSTLEYRPLLGDDPVAASLATNGALFDVPHFSTAGVASVDDRNACTLPDAVPGNTAEAIATTAVTDHFAFVACVQSIGGSAEIDTAFVSQAMQPWFDDLVARTADASAEQLRTFGELVAEVLRYEILAQHGGLEVSLVDNEASQNLFDVFRARIQAFDTACQGGDTSSTDDFVRWSGKVFRLFGGGRPDSWVPPTVGCLVTARVVPEGPHAVVVDSAPIVFEPVVTGADGRDLSSFAVLALNWDNALGGNRPNGNLLELDTSSVGLRESKLAPSYFRFAEAPYARAVVVYDHTGTRQIDSAGTATTCDDPDDDGGREYFIPTFAILSQSTVATSDTSAAVTISGTGSNGTVTVDNLAISVVYDDNTENSLSGTATGSLSFTETGIDEATMEPYTTTGNLDLGSETVFNDLFGFTDVSGSDTDGCDLHGTVELGGVLAQ